MENITLITDMVYEILLPLDSNSLLQMSSTDSYFNTIINSDHFWRLKVIHDYGEEIVILKPDHETFRQQYLYIKNVHPDQAADDGRLDAMRWMVRDNRFFNSLTVSLAVGSGNLEVVKLLAEQSLLPDKFDIEDPDTSEDIIKWYEMVTALLNSDLDELKDKELDIHAANLALIFGKIDVLNYLNILPDEKYLDIPVYNLDYESLEWLKERGIFPTQHAANISATYGNIAMLEWLESNNILPNEEGANRAAEREDTETLEWLAERNIFPNDEFNESSWY